MILRPLPQWFVVLSLIVPCLASAAPGVTVLQENKPIEVDGLAALANAPAVEDITLSGLLVKGKPASTSFVRPVALPGGQRALAWSECSKAGCMGFWAIIDGDNESLKVVARGPLPVKDKVSADDGYTFMGSAVVSWDDKGKQPFVILHYQVEEAAKKGGAPVRHDYATFLDPVTKKVAFQRELKRTAAMTEPSCSYGLVARSEKGVPAVEVNSSCALRSCLETRPTPKDCAPPTTARNLFVLKKGMFTQVK